MRPRVIRVEYEIKVKGGDTLESSADLGPLEIVLGQRRLLPALEERIAELSAGEQARGEIPASEAFGNEELLPLKAIPRGEFPPEEKLVKGRTFEARSADGQDVRFRIVELVGDLVHVRFLHPLAESDLEYWVKVVAIEVPGRRPAPPPMPASAVGIDSAAIQIIDSARIELFDEHMRN